jgi:DNA-binding GntR family transcriptional regulator
MRSQGPGGDLAGDGTAGATADAGPAPVRHPRLVEVVADELRRLIVAGHWAPGDRLVEAHLATELGVSRNPVREALHALEAEGWVEVEPRKGARVTMLSLDEAEHLFHVRGALEALAAGLAARRRTTADVDALRTIVDAGTRAVDSDRLGDLPALNTAFHVMLCDTARNPELTTLMRPLRDRIQWMYAARVRDRAPASWAEHAEIVDAVAAGDEALARRRAGEHIARATAAFRDWSLADVSASVGVRTP